MCVLNIPDSMGLSCTGSARRWRAETLTAQRNSCGGRALPVVCLVPRDVCMTPGLCVTLVSVARGGARTESVVGARSSWKLDGRDGAWSRQPVLVQGLGAVDEVGLHLPLCIPRISPGRLRIVDTEPVPSRAGLLGTRGCGSVAEPFGPSIVP